MFSSMVVSHDGSHSIEDTLKWLEPLLGSARARVELLGRKTPSSSELSSQPHLEELAERLRSAGAEAEVATEALLSSLDRQLVMAHGEDLAFRLLRNSRASVFFTPSAVTPHVPEKILIPLDGSRSAEEILPLLVPFARAFEPKVELVGMVKECPGEGALKARPGAIPTRASTLRSLERAWQYLQEAGIDARCRVVETGVLARRLLKEIDSNGSEMIALTSRGRGFFSRLFSGSCAEALIRAGRVPLLIHNARA